MDVIAGYQPRASASLDQTAVLLGFPGKLGMSGDKVWDKFKEGGIREIRDYCETDVLNTWLIYLRFELMRGNLDDADLALLALVRGCRHRKAVDQAIYGGIGRLHLDHAALLNLPPRVPLAVKRVWVQQRDDL